MKRRSSDAAMRGTDGGNLLQGEKGADKVRRDATSDFDVKGVHRVLDYAVAAAARASSGENIAGSSSQHASANIEIEVFSPNPRHSFLLEAVKSGFELASQQVSKFFNSPPPEPENTDCPICFGAAPTFSAAGCDHAICQSCAVQYVRGALGDAQSQIFPEGIRCFMHMADCECHISAEAAATLLSKDEKKRLDALAATGEALPGTPAHLERQKSLGSKAFRWINNAWAQRNVAPWIRQGIAARLGRGTAAGLPPPDEHLTLEEVRKLTRFMLQQAIPEGMRTFCPKCKLLVLLPQAKLPPHLREQPAAAAAAAGKSSSRASTSTEHVTTRPTTNEKVVKALKMVFGCGCCALPLPPDNDVTCPHCSHRWTPGHATGDQSYDERASRALINLTSRACPNPRCRQRISHFHGHDCHHISPGTNGCPYCHQHFCYVCGRKHGSPGTYSRNMLCPHGSSYCDSRNIVENLVLTPYPHDRRCGCQICSLCRRGKPCAQCSGRCVVCLGLVQPGPTTLSAEAVREAEVMEAGGSCRFAVKTRWRQAMRRVRGD